MLNILVVDDEIYAMRGVIENTDWKKLGFGGVFTATSYVQALSVFEKNRVDVMLCDIEMPGKNGLELVKYVCESSPKTQSIILSCHDDFAFVKQALVLGCKDYLLKPLIPEDLAELLQRIIADMRASGEYEALMADGENDARTQNDGTGQDGADKAEDIGEKERENPEIPENVRASAAFIREHLDAPLSVEGIASHYYMSPDHFSRLYKKYMGMSLNDYIIDQRMKKAADLLKDRKNSVSYVSAKVGYLNFSYFTRQFKKNYGCTPREYQNSCQNSQQTGQNT